jgi:serine phosphatase RsbU (regulator of sigma subunit)
MGVFRPPESFDRAILDRCKHSTGRPILLPDQGFPIGLFPDVEYQEQSKVLSPGDRLFLYADGFTEASDSSGREYGAEGFLDAIAASRCPSIRWACIAALSAHRGKARNGLLPFIVP